MSAYTWKLVRNPYSLDWRYSRNGDDPSIILSFDGNWQTYCIIDFRKQPVDYSLKLTVNEVYKWFREKRI